MEQLELALKELEDAFVAAQTMIVVYLYGFDGRAVAQVSVPVPMPRVVSWQGRQFSWDGKCYREEAIAYGAAPPEVYEVQTASNLEALRQEIVAGCEEIIRHRLVTTARQRALAGAQAKFWSQAADAELQRLTDLIAHHEKENET